MSDNTHNTLVLALITQIGLIVLWAFDAPVTTILMAMSSLIFTLAVAICCAISAGSHAIRVEVKNG